MSCYSLNEGLWQKSIPPTSLDTYPKRFYIFLVTQKQIAGDMSNIPNVYGNFDMETLQLDVNGRIYSYENMDFENEKTLAMEAYWSTIYRSLGKVGGDCLFDVVEWSKFYNIYCFDVTETTFSAECPMVTTPPETPTFSIFVKFRVKLPEACEMMVITESDRIMSIDSSGSVS